MTICLFVCRIMQILLIGSTRKKLEDGSWPNVGPFYLLIRASEEVCTLGVLLILFIHSSGSLCNW